MAGIPAVQRVPQFQKRCF